MAQIFHPSMNIVAKTTIFGAVFILALAGWAGGMLVRSDYVTQVHVVRDQPVPFSHQHHVRQLGLDCRYCHSTVEHSATAGMPSTEICMGCHAQIWKSSPMLAPVRDSLRTGKPIEWTRVHDLPDFVYFNHGIHLAKGIGCESCHGRVDEMPLMRRNVTLHMDWCLKCHRHPESNVRKQDDLYQFGMTSGRGPREFGQANVALTTHAAQAPSDVQNDSRSHSAGSGDQVEAELSQRDVGSRDSRSVRSDNRDPTGWELVEKYQIATKQITDCVVCHR